MATKVIGIGLAEALDRGVAEATLHLARQLAQQIEGELDAVQREALVKAFLATMTRLKAWEIADRREQRLLARQVAKAENPSTVPGLVDELRSARERRLTRGKKKYADA